MTEREAEELVLHLWKTTDIPLTNVHIARASGWPVKDVEHAMRALMRAGKVDMDVAADGEICWNVPGVPRGKAPSAVVEKPPALKVTVEPPAPQGISVGIPGTAVKLTLKADPERKSLLLSGGMGLLFGPFGWLYAAPWRECAAGIGAYTLIALLLPRFLMGPFFGLVHPTCGVLAMLYAWNFNRGKERVPLLFPGPRNSPGPGPEPGQ